MRTPSSGPRSSSLIVTKGRKNTDPLSFNFTDSCIQSNLCFVGIHIGQDRSSINASLAK
jgi:hypothetical protein